MPLDEPEHEVRRIREYMAMESGEKVVRVRKVATRYILGGNFAIWDVQTDRSRWWCITNPVDLYSQEQWPDFDGALAMHLGGSLVRAATSDWKPSGPEESRILAARRVCRQAQEELDSAEEAQQFQAVGMRCREALLTLTASLSTPAILKADQPVPKAGDFTRWAESIAGALAPGSRNESLRSYLKSISREAWQYVSWLTHHRNAVRVEAKFGVDATTHLLDSFAAALVVHESPPPERCPRCDSYRVDQDFRHDPDTLKGWYWPVCAACGWQGEEVEARTW